MGLFDFIKRKQSLLQSGVLQGATDRHSHILFGVDDGIRTLEDSLAVLAYDEEIGIKEVWCTPHIMEDVPNTTEALKKRFAELQAAYSGPIKLHLAAEYMLDTLFEERFKEGDLLTMEDNTVLVETSTWNPPPDMSGTLRRIQKAGYRPLLAHPERYLRLLSESDLVDLHTRGLRYQGNLGSLAGLYGPQVQRLARRLHKSGLYTTFGTDAHSSAMITKMDLAA